MRKGYLSKKKPEPEGLEDSQLIHNAKAENPSEERSAHEAGQAFNGEITGGAGPSSAASAKATCTSRLLRDWPSISVAVNVHYSSRTGSHLKVTGGSQAVTPPTGPGARSFKG